MSLSFEPKTTALVPIDLQSGILSMALSPYGCAEVLDAAVTLGRAF